MNTFEKLLKIFEEVFEDEINMDGITPDSRLKEDIGMKSIGYIYIAMAIEEEFGVKFTNEDMVNIVTVQDVVNRIERR